MIVLLRFLPFAIALLQAIVFVQQITHPLQYPWIVLIGVLALPVASVCIAWRRVRFFDWIEKMVPSFILVAALAFALLLSESAVSYGVISSLAVISTFVSLELLFILAFDQSRYPVNALSRVNIAYVPIATWYIASNSTGLLTFVHAERIWHVVAMTLLAAVIFRTTGHPGATKEQNAAWTLVGALIGLHTGLLGIFLPFSMPMHGIVAALILCSALRARRYMYAPKPSGRQAWVEGASALSAMVAVLTTAKWL